MLDPLFVAGLAVLALLTISCMPRRRRWGYR